VKKKECTSKKKKRSWGLSRKSLLGKTHLRGLGKEKIEKGKNLKERNSRSKTREQQ